MGVHATQQRKSGNTRTQKHRTRKYTRVCFLRPSSTTEQVTQEKKKTVLFFHMCLRWRTNGNVYEAVCFVKSMQNTTPTLFLKKIFSSLNLG